MLQLQQQKQSSHLPNELQQLEQRIAYTDAAINKKVYALYGLSEEEVRVVEGGVIERGQLLKNCPFEFYFFTL